MSAGVAGGYCAGMWRGLLLIFCFGPIIAAGAAPQRIASLNLVSDIVLLDLVPAERIAALSTLAGRAELSPVAEHARALPCTRPDAEAVLALQPDLVIGARWGQGATLDLLRRLGIPVHEVPLAESYGEIEALVRGLAAAVGEPEQGEDLIARMNRVRAEVRARAGARAATALLFQPGGFSGGETDLAAEVLADAGLVRAVRGRLDLEQLVTCPPEVMVEVAYLPGWPTLAGQLMDHPAVGRLRPEVRVIPLAVLLNATHRTPEASRRIQEAAP